MLFAPLINKILTILERRIKLLEVYIWERRTAQRNASLRANRESDYKRWKCNNELHRNWDDRTSILASLISHESHIIEFGAGNLSLKKFLPENCIYQASDIVPRFPGVLLCDLNRPLDIDLAPYDTAVFSGVLEYVYDIEGLFEYLSPHISVVILSYACSDISNADRKRKGWLSDFTQKELEGIFESHGYEIVRLLEWRTQALYKLERKRSS